MNHSIYDLNSYYAQDGRASRLSAIFNPLLWFLDAWKAYVFCRRAGLQPGAAVLDVGAGDGKFLAFIQHLGMKPFGTTASACSQEAAKQLHGINLLYTTALDEAASPGSLAAITYWHVFEHLTHPEEHVRQWARLLQPNGIVMIEVPRVDGIGARICYDAWLGSDPEHHVNHLPAAALIRMMTEAGFGTIRHEGFSLKFSYVFLWSSLLGRLFGTRHYSFDTIFGLLKEPAAVFREKPFMACNAVLALIYLMPLIMLLLPLGLILDKGEVLRIYLRYTGIH